MPELRVSVAGAGALGRIHLNTVASSSRARLVHVHDHHLTGDARQAIEAAGAQASDLDVALDPDEVDVVVIATPTDTHAEIACRAIDSGIAVFTEKPLARTVAEAEAVAERARQCGVKVAVGHVVRHFPEYAAARELVLGGGLGRVVSARLARLNSAPAAVADWYADGTRSGGVLLDMAIHDLDWCLWTFGPATRVFASCAGDAAGQVAAVTVRHRSGVISYLDASWRDNAFSTHLELAGTGGVYRTGGSTGSGLDVTLTGATAGGYLPATADDPGDPYRLELLAALDWFAGDESAPVATVDDGLDAVRLAHAAIRSAETGRPIVLDEELS